MFWIRSLGLIAAIVGAAAPASAEPHREPYREECPAGSYLTGFEGQVGDWINHLRIVCARWDATRGRLKTPLTTGAAVGGSVDDRDSKRADCPAGWLVNDTQRFDFARWGDDETPVLHSIGFTCRTTGEPLQDKGAFFGSRSFIKRAPGHEERVALDTSCFPGQVATGIEGEHGEFIFSLTLICAEPPKASSAAGTKVIGAAKAKSYDSKSAASGTRRVGNDIIAASPAAEPSPPPPPAQKTATAKADVNIHERATGASRVLGIMRRDKTFPVVASDPEGDWYLLQFDGAGGAPNGQGWVTQTWLTINQ